MIGGDKQYVLSPEVLRFRDFEKDPPGVWLWAPGAANFVRTSERSYRTLSAGELNPAALLSLGLWHFIEPMVDDGILLDGVSLRESRMWLHRAHCLSESGDLRGAVCALNRARRSVPSISSLWFQEAFALLRCGEQNRAAEIMNHYLEFRPGDPTARSLLDIAQEDSASFVQTHHLLIVCERPQVARKVGQTAERLTSKISGLLGGRSKATVLLNILSNVRQPPLCILSGSPFMREVRLSAHVICDLFLAHELTHALLFSANLALSEGLAVHVCALLGRQSDADVSLSEFARLLEQEETAGVPLEELFLDPQHQARTFEHAFYDGRVSPAYRMAGHGIALLAHHFGLMKVVRFMDWLRHPAPAMAVEMQERLFRFHFGESMRAALRHFDRRWRHEG